eukprot:m.160529 g.160529  ORF g.160529 m.160529 type:complete len:943 (-) comp10275_c0_seq9:1724-4552(-)
MSDERTPAELLSSAIRSGRTDIVRALMGEAAQQSAAQLHSLLTSELRDQDAPADQPGASPLRFAIQLNKPDIVRTLLAVGASPEDGTAATPFAEIPEQIRQVYHQAFLHAIAEKDCARVEEFLRAGVDINADDGGSARNSALHWAASFADARLAELLCTHGANVNARNKDGATPLHDAAQRADLALVRVLLQYGADKNIAGVSGAAAERVPAQMVPDAELAVLAVLAGENANVHDGAHASGGGSEHMDLASETGDDGPNTSEDDRLPLVAPLDRYLLKLWPQPQHLLQLAGDMRLQLCRQRVLVYWAVAAGGPSHTETSFEWVWDRMCDQLQRRFEMNVQRCAFPAANPNIVCRINSALASRVGSYRIFVNPGGISMVAGDAEGLNYAVSTLLQLFHMSDCLIDSEDERDSTRGLPSLRINDWPNIKDRGFMYDISRNKVPTMSFLFELVDMMAYLKYNQLQLYMEHTFAYVDHSEVWSGSDPLTSSEVLELERYCRRRGILLVPNQNCFGHFHRFLKHDRYRALSECPDGIDLGPRVSGPSDAPFSLCPTDMHSVTLVSSLLQELLPHFPSSPYVHVGLDETFDLGKGRSKQACDEHGIDQVYLNYLQQIREVVRQNGRTMMFWADMLFDYADDLAFRLPPDVIAMEWGYEDDHPFSAHCGLLTAAAVPFYVCPGTSAWNSVAGRVTNCIENIRNAASAGVRHDALGLLLTDWGDSGHIQPFSASLPGLVAAAGFAWGGEPQTIAPRAPREQTADWHGLWDTEDLAIVMDTHIIRDPHGVVGTVICELGNAYLHAGASLFNRSALFRLVVFTGDNPNLPPTVTLTSLRMAMRLIKAQIKVLEDYTASHPLESLPEALRLWIEETRLSADLLLFAVLFGQAFLRANNDILGISAAVRTDLANRLLPLRDRIEMIWLRRNRPGDIQDTRDRLQHTLDALLQGS